MKFERYTEEEALDEADKMKAKLASGAAKSYPEAESMVERERALEAVRRKHEGLIEHSKEVAEEEGKRRSPTPEEIKEAKEIIAEYLAAGEFPKITVSRDHLEEIIEKGLTARPTAYQKDVKLIVGTLGRDPFLPEDQDRVILEIHADPKRVTPRFTGEAKAFEGVVALDVDRIPPEAIHIIDPKAGEDATGKAA